MHQVVVSALILMAAVLFGADIGTADDDDDDRRTSAVVAVAEGLTVAPCTVVELAPIEIGAFRTLSLLGKASGPALAIDWFYVAEPVQLSSAAHLRAGGRCLVHVSLGVRACEQPFSGIPHIGEGTYTVGGPFFAARVSSGCAEVSASTLNLKLFLSR